MSRKNNYKIFINFYFSTFFIAVVGFGITCFCAGYTFGKDSNKPQK